MRGSALRPPIVALVGYTNAGKSTLFRALTGADDRGVGPALHDPRPPDPQDARLGSGRDVLLVDTVGFIQKLPHALVAAFRATLEEVVEADLLLHVMDASADDVEQREEAVEAVLKEIGAAERPRIPVLNKADRIAPARARALQEARPESVVVSAQTGDGSGRPPYRCGGPAGAAAAERAASLQGRRPPRDRGGVHRGARRLPTRSRTGT